MSKLRISLAAALCAGMEPTEGVSLTPILNDSSALGRDFALFGRERHDEARPANAGYPIRDQWKGTDAVN